VASALTLAFVIGGGGVPNAAMLGAGLAAMSRQNGSRPARSRLPAVLVAMVIWVSSRAL
jgi:hypothetical protein